MLGAGIVLALLVVPYLAMNVRRLRRGDRWAITYCHVLMEADRAAQARRRAERSAGPPPARLADAGP